MTPENAVVADGALIGQCIDERYRLEAVIGVGGLGSVYRATHTKLQRSVAVKLLHESFGESQVQRGRFAREAKALAALQHPNIVAVVDYGVSEARPYLVMELLEGETLSQRLHGGPLAVGPALHVVAQLLEALSFMHRARLVHRDVKPSNVFLQRLRDGHDRVKVLDFGLAKFTAPALVTSDPTLTRDGAILGTPAYMSPEQATGEIVDARSDVYAAGVILFRMLAGRLPFEGDAIEQVRSHLIAPVPSLDRAQPDAELDPVLEAVIKRAMAKRREDRFEDAGQMLRALIEGFPQYVRGALPEHEPILPDPFAVDALNADWLLSKTDASSDVPTIPRDPRPSSPSRPSNPSRPSLELTRGSVQKVGRAMRTLAITSFRLFAGISVLLVVGAGAIFVLLLRSEDDRAELSALQRRVSDRLIERSIRAPAPAPPAKSPAGAIPEASAKPPAAQRVPPVSTAGVEAVPPPRVAAANDPSPAGDAPAAPTAAGAPPSTAAPASPVPANAAAPAVVAPSNQVAADTENVALALAAPQPAAPAPAVVAPALETTMSPSQQTSQPENEVTAVPPSGRLAAALERAGSSGSTALALLPQPSAADSGNTPSGGSGLTRPPAVDPWQRPLPTRLRTARKVVLANGKGTEALVLALRDYNRDQREDPRGHLLLGQLYMNRYWRTDALSQFSIALALDASVRGAPEVLNSLLALVIQGSVASEAERQIASRFGAEALPAIESALATNKEPKASARLRLLRARLSSERAPITAAR